MNTGAQLLANSSLSSGAAWALLANPKGPSGSFGLVVNDGITVEVEVMSIDVEFDDQASVVEVDQGDLSFEINDEPITIEVEEW